MSETPTQIQLKEIENERTLGRIVEKMSTTAKFYTWGVILDCSEPFQKTEDSRFTIKMKIIDHSFNFESEIKNKDLRFQNYATVFVFSGLEDGLPKVYHMGDIIRMRRFSWAINERGELIGYVQKFSNWMTFNHSSTDYNMASMLNIISNVDKKLSEFEKRTLKGLRQWTQQFFENHSIRKVTWWSKLKEVSDDFSKVQGKTFENVDLVLKVVEMNTKEGVIIYIDEREHRYWQKFNGELIFGVAEVLKFRAVNIAIDSKRRTLSLTQNSSVLKINPSFLDAKVFNEQFYLANKEKLECRGLVFKKKGGENNFPTKQSVLEVYPFLREYYFEEHLIEKKGLIDSPTLNRVCSTMATLLKKDFCNKAPTFLSTFLSSKKELNEQIKFQKFVLSVKIVDFEIGDFQTTFYTFCKRCFKSKRFAEEHTFKCCDLPVNICVFLKLFVWDESISESKKVPVYILPKSQESNPFAIWNILPDLTDYNMWSYCNNQTLEEFRSKINSLKIWDGYVKLVVEAKETENGKLFLELGDTMFMP